MYFSVLIFLHFLELSWKIQHILLKKSWETSQISQIYSLVNYPLTVVDTILCWIWQLWVWNNDQHQWTYLTKLISARKRTAYINWKRPIAFFPLLPPINTSSILRHTVCLLHKKSRALHLWENCSRATLIPHIFSWVKTIFLISCAHWYAVLLNCLCKEGEVFTKLFLLGTVFSSYLCGPLRQWKHGLHFNLLFIYIAQLCFFIHKNVCDMTQILWWQLFKKLTRTYSSFFWMQEYLLLPSSLPLCNVALMLSWFIQLSLIIFTCSYIYICPKCCSWGSSCLGSYLLVVNKNFTASGDFDQVF